jgi:O-antigen ligase
MAKGSLTRVGLATLGAGVGGALAWGAASLPALPALAGVAGTVCLSMSARSSWLGVVLLFGTLNILLGSFSRPPAWQAGFFGFLFALLAVLGYVKRREGRLPWHPLRAPLACWMGVVGFSLVPAFQHGLSLAEWYPEALPLLLPALVFLIPARFVDRQSLNKFLVALVVLGLPLLVHFTLEYLQFQRLYGPAAHVTRVDYGTFYWQAEGFAVWQFFALAALSAFDRSRVRRVAFTGLAALTFLMIFLWMRRTGLAALTLGSLFLAAWLCYEGGWWGARASVRLGLVIALVCAGSVWGLGASGYVDTDKLLANYGLGFRRGLGDPSAAWRWKEYPFVVSAFWESPWVGHGFGYSIPGIRAMYSKRDLIEIGEPGPYLHNFSSHLLVKTGLLGLAAYVWFLTAAWRFLVRSAREAAATLDRGLLVAGLAALVTLVARSPLDDVLFDHLSQFPLAILITLAVHRGAGSGLLRSAPPAAGATVRG